MCSLSWTGLQRCLEYQSCNKPLWEASPVSRWFLGWRILIVVLVVWQEWSSLCQGPASTVNSAGCSTPARTRQRRLTAAAQCTTGTCRYKLNADTRGLQMIMTMIYCFLPELYGHANKCVCMRVRVWTVCTCSTCLPVHLLSHQHMQHQKFKSVSLKAALVWSTVTVVW